MELKIIRVELHGATTEEDYNNLHAYMERNGWKRQIFPNAPGATGGPINLPTAMYCGDSDQSSANIAEGLRIGINAEVWTNCIVLVMGVGTNWAIRWN